MFQRKPWWDGDTFTLRRLSRVRERHLVLDQRGKPVAFLVRPRRDFRSLFVFVGVAMALSWPVALVTPNVEARSWVVLACFLLALLVYRAHSKRRTAVFYGDRTRREPLLEVSQDSKSTWTVRQPYG